MNAPSRRIGRILVVLALLTASAPLSVDIYTPSLPAIQSELGGDEWLAQASITACLLGIGLGQLVWGPLSDRVGRRPVVIAGAAGWAITSVASAVAGAPAALILARGLAGLCGAAGIVVSRSIVRDLSPDRAAVASRIGILAMVTAVAPVVAPVIGAAIAAVAGWRADFAALAILGGLVVVLCAVFVPETLAGADRAASSRTSVLRGLARAIRDRELRFVALALGAHSIGFYAYIASASFVVEREYGRPPLAFAAVFASNAVAMLLGNIVFRRLVRRLHPSVPLGIGLGVSAVAGAVLVGTAVGGGPVWIVWAASSVFAAATGFVLPGAHSWGQATPALSGAASALTGAAQFFGGVLGSPLTGLIGPTAGTLGAIVALSSGAAIGFWARARRLRS